MANTFVTLKTIARQALPVLIDNLVMPNLIHRDFSEEFHDVGDTVQVRKPVVFTAEDFDAEAGVNWQDMREEGVDVTLDHIATVDARASAIESATGIADLNRVFIEPAAAALAEKINRDGLKLYADVHSFVGSAGVTPAGLAELSDARRMLNMNRAPMSGRCAVWDTEADAKLAQLPAIVNAEKSGSVEALREGSLGRVYGMENYMSQGVCKHVSGLTAAEGVKQVFLVPGHRAVLLFDHLVQVGRAKAVDHAVDRCGYAGPFPGFKRGIIARETEHQRGVAAGGCAECAYALGIDVVFCRVRAQEAQRGLDVLQESGGGRVPAGAVRYAGDHVAAARKHAQLRNLPELVGLRPCAALNKDDQREAASGGFPHGLQKLQGELFAVCA